MIERDITRASYLIESWAYAQLGGDEKEVKRFRQWLNDPPPHERIRGVRRPQDAWDAQLSSMAAAYKAKVESGD